MFWSANLDSCIVYISDTGCYSLQGKKVGVFQKDNFHGDFMDGWNGRFKKNSFEKVVLNFCNVPF